MKDNNKADNNKENNNITIILALISAFVAIIVAVIGSPIISEIFGHDGADNKPEDVPPLSSVQLEALSVQKEMTGGALVYSDITEMNISEAHWFSACVALNDSIGAAKREIMTSTHVGEKSLLSSNTSIEGTEKGIRSSSAGIVPMNVSTLTKVVLIGDDFNIHRRSNDTLTISKMNPGHNYGQWIWSVTPTKEGIRYLDLKAYAIINPSNSNIPPMEIGSATVRIKVIVKPGPEKAAEEEAAAAETAEAAAVTAAETAETAAEAAAETAEAANKTAEAATETAEAAAEPAQSQPGFEGIFAVTGLLAVAYLVLGRKQ